MFHRLQILSVLVLIMFVSRSEAGSLCEGQLTCPTFWTLWRNHCYRYFGEEVSWYDALNTCRMFSTEENLRGFADLVSIHSQDEHDFVYHYWRSLREIDTRSNKPGLWIGLNDVEENGAHVWTDHSDVNYTNFDRQQELSEVQSFYLLWDWKDETWQPHGKWHDVEDIPASYFKFMCKMAARPYSPDNIE